jgi:hypothetical protein
VVCHGVCNGSTFTGGEQLTKAKNQNNKNKQNNKKKKIIGNTFTDYNLDFFPYKSSNNFVHPPYLRFMIALSLVVPHATPLVAPHATPLVAPHATPLVAPHATPLVAPHATPLVVPHATPLVVPHATPHTFDFPALGTHFNSYCGPATLHNRKQPTQICAPNTRYFLIRACALRFTKNA